MKEGAPVSKRSQKTLPAATATAAQARNGGQSIGKPTKRPHFRPPRTAPTGPVVNVPDIYGQFPPIFSHPHHPGPPGLVVANIMLGQLASGPRPDARDDPASRVPGRRQEDPTAIVDCAPRTIGGRTRIGLGLRPDSSAPFPQALAGLTRGADKEVVVGQLAADQGDIRVYVHIELLEQLTVGLTVLPVM